MADLLDGLKVSWTDIVGNSFGGFLALNTALALPSRVGKVVLISPAATFVPIPAWAWHFMPANAIGRMIGSGRMLLKPYEWIWQDFPRESFIFIHATASDGMGRCLGGSNRLPAGQS